MGNHGLATTFFNDANGDIGEDLTKILLETDQHVPEFMDQYRPADGELNFDEPSEDEADAGGFGGNAGGDGDGDDNWGAGDAGDDAGAGDAGGDDAGW